MPLYQAPSLDTTVLSQFSLKGKFAIVTGGSRGIGLEAVIGLAQAGADVAFIYNTNKDAVKTAEKVAAEAGVRVAGYQCDVTDRQAVMRTIDDITATFGSGRLDIVVANAGVCRNASSLEYSEEDFQYTTRVNVDGVMWTAMAAGKHFKKAGKGNLIITGSVSATLVNTPEHQSGYNASKAAVVHLAKNLAVEWVDFARVNCISPGYVLTEMVTAKPKELMDQWLRKIPARRLCQPQELRSIFVFAASDACCYMTGANLIVDGGFTLS